MADPTADFQSRSSLEGRHAQESAEMVLNGCGFKSIRKNVKIPPVGITMNFVAEDSQGNTWYFDVSGSFTSNRPGLIRTDTLWKTLGRANIMSSLGHTRLVFLTTNLPKDKTVGQRALSASSGSFFDAIEYWSTEGRFRLKTYAKGRSVPLPIPGIRTLHESYKPLTTSAPPFGALYALPSQPIGDLVPVDVPLKFKCLPHRLKVFLPSKDRQEQPILPTTRTLAVAEIKTLLSQDCGGFTAFDGRGGWVDPSIGLVDEDVTAIEAYSESPLSEELVSDVVAVILLKLDQAATAIVVDSQMLIFELPSQSGSEEISA
jgi:hypothetical protein